MKSSLDRYCHSIYVVSIISVINSTVYGWGVAKGYNCSSTIMRWGVAKGIY